MQNGALIALAVLAAATVLAGLVVLGAAIYLVLRGRGQVMGDLELMGRQDRLDSQLKQLRDEWESTRSNLDTIIRRGIRLKVLEGKREPEGDLAHAAIERPMTRADLLKRALSNARPEKKEA